MGAGAKACAEAARARIVAVFIMLLV